MRLLPILALTFAVACGEKEDTGVETESTEDTPAARPTPIKLYCAATEVVPLLVPSSKP